MKHGIGTHFKLYWSRQRSQDLCVAVIVLTALATVSPEAVAKKAKPAEGQQKQTILKAQELVLSNERAQAIKLLVEALEKENKGSKAYSEYKKALTSLSEIFYTEKAQKAYELGRSLALKDAGLGEEKFAEALSVEPDNFQIMRELVRAHLAKEDCKRALEVSNGALLMNPYSTDFFILKLQAKSCLDTIVDIEAEATNPLIEAETVAHYVETLKAKFLYKKEQYRAAAEHALKVKSKEPGFPEGHYWLAQAKNKIGLSALEDYETYLSLCKESDLAKVRRAYKFEPRACSNTKSVQELVVAIKEEKGE